MTRKVTRFTMIFELILLGTVAGYQGCGSDIHSTGPASEADYDWGTLEATLDDPLEASYRAAKDALAELELPILHDTQDDIAAELATRDAHDEEITIRLEALPGSRTQMTIHASPLGDKNKSHVIFNQIMDNLTSSS